MVQSVSVTLAASQIPNARFRNVEGRRQVGSAVPDQHAGSRRIDRARARPLQHGDVVDIRTARSHAFQPLMTRGESTEQMTPCGTPGIVSRKMTVHRVTGLLVSSGWLLFSCSDDASDQVSGIEILTSGWMFGSSWTASVEPIVICR
jgi:hypothetical protein